MTKITEFETKRLRLRQWRETDFAAFARFNADPRVMKFFPDVLDRKASDNLAKRIQRAISDRGWGLWAVEVKADNTFIGFVGLQEAPPDLPFSPCVEIGWRLGSLYWGKGYATEAAQECLRVGFEKLNLGEIVSYTAVSNLPSRRVMERLHMQQAAETFEHPRIPLNHPLRTHCLYRLSRKRWLIRAVRG